MPSFANPANLIPDLRPRSAFAPEVTDAHSFLRAVYQNPEVPLAVRLKAAIEAIQYEKPRLAVTASIDGKGIAALLEARLKRIAEAKLVRDREYSV